MTLWPVIRHALVSGAVLSVALSILLLAVLRFNAEILLNDYPPDIRKQHGPMSERTRRQRIPVALAITDDRVCYENPDLDACLELQHIDEVEYDDETSMGQSVEGRVLRIRSHGHGFEFVIDNAVVAQFEAALPPKKMGSPQRKAV